MADKTSDSAAFETALARAVAGAREARAVLASAAYLGARRIPVRVFSPGIADPVGVKAAVDALIGEGLARLEALAGGGAGISVEGKTQVAMRDVLERAGEETAAVDAVVRLVAAAYPGGEEAGDPRSWSACEQLDEHVRAVLAVAPDEGPGAEYTSELLHRLAQYLFGRARYEDAEPIVRRSGAIDETTLGPDHPRVGQDQANLAILLYEMGRHAEGLPHIRRAMAIGELELGPEHPVVAERYNVLATLLEALGRSAEADPYIRHALLAAERTLGPDHPETQGYRSNYDKIIAAVDRIARRDDDVEAGLAPPSPERLARPDIPPPPLPGRKGVLGRLLKRA